MAIGAKHFAPRLALVRVILREGTRDIKLNFMATADNQAGQFTKGLGKMKTQQHLLLL